MGVYLSKKNRIRARSFLPFNDSIEKLPLGACSICSFRSNNFRQIGVLSRTDRTGRNSGWVKNIQVSWKRFSYSLYHFIGILVAFNSLFRSKRNVGFDHSHYDPPRSTAILSLLHRDRTSPWVEPDLLWRSAWKEFNDRFTFSELE